MADRAHAGTAHDIRKGLGAAEPAAFLQNQAYYPTNTGSVRFWLPWQWVQATPGQALGSNANWKVLDEAVQLARSNGLAVLITLRAVSSWGTLYTNNPTGSLFTQPGSLPSDLLDSSGLPKADGPWNQFVQFTARRYNSLAPGAVSFEIENEPNATNFWNGSIPDYTNLLATTDYWIKNVAPEAVVLAAALACDKQQTQRMVDLDQWQHAILTTKQAQGGPSPPLAFDVLAVHDYFFPGHWRNAGAGGWSDDNVNGWTFSSYLHHLITLAHNANVTVPIWITETGYAAEGAALPNLDADPFLQAAWLTSAFYQAYALGVQRVFWLFARDDPGGGVFQYMGLSQSDGTQRPAYLSYTRPTPFIALFNQELPGFAAALGFSTANGGSLTLALGWTPGSTNRIWTGSDLGATQGLWGLSSTFVTDSNGFFKFTSTNILSGASRFYRISSP